MTSTPESNLDALILLYFETLDLYQAQTAALSKHFSAGFLELASANFQSSTPGRYGRDYWHSRMSAMRGVDIGEGAYGAEFRMRAVPAEGGEKDGGTKDEQDVKEEGLRRRRKGAIEEEKEEQDQKKYDEDERDDTKEETSSTPPPQIDPRDPLRWFGILVPPSLRASQSSFTSSLTPLSQLATTKSRLSHLSTRITHFQRCSHLYKILPRAPQSPLPPRIPPLPLDESSGYIHLCTEMQIEGVVSRFMGELQTVWVLKVSYDSIAENVKWEPVELADGKTEEFPHLFSELESSSIVDMEKLDKTEEDGWDSGVLRAYAERQKQ